MPKDTLIKHILEMLHKVDKEILDFIYKLLQYEITK